MRAQSYVERPPPPALADLVHVVWIQRTGAEPYPQRHLPTGGVELHCRIGALPALLGPLTRATVEILPPGTTVVGVRFRPGAATPVLGLPASELVDLALSLDHLWGRDAAILGDLLAAAGTPEASLSALEAHLVARRARTRGPDSLISQAVRRLMPWRTADIGVVSGQLGISQSQLRRRCRAAVGLGPKALQRTLRFQGFLALVQAGAGAGEGIAAAVGVDRVDETRGVGMLAAEAGYADQAHLSRECLRLTGLPPRAFLADRASRCDCGHDHSASYGPILRARGLHERVRGLDERVPRKDSAGRPAGADERIAGTRR